jgi:hypothetical protein
LVKTPEGTLRIESQAKNVQVELVDEADRTTTVRIEEGENTTQLRAGKYRIRLAGKHDNLALTPGAIELRRGEERLARIAQLPPDASAKQNADGGSRPDERDMRATNEELTQVTIPVEYEDGRPVTKAEVTTRMQGNRDRPVVVTGKADAQGVAFNRNLPYGKYEMTIRVAEGDGANWSVTLPDIVLEFGGSYKRRVVAPAPAERATVKVHTAFNSTALQGLRFGVYSGRKANIGFSIIYSPDPGKDDDRFAHSPVLGNGISDAAILMLMKVTRNVKQPSSDTLNWHWKRGESNYLKQLMVTDESVIDIKENDWDGNVASGFPESDYFRNMPKERGVAFFKFPDWQRGDKSLSLEFPPGELQCEVRAILGKATREVTQSLGLKPEAGRGVWLEATLNAESAWVARGIDLSDWSRGTGSNTLTYKTFWLKPGETQMIRVASPPPSNR